MRRIALLLLIASAAWATPTKYPIAADTTQISTGKYLLIKGSVAGDTMIVRPTWTTIGRSTTHNWWRKAGLASTAGFFNPLNIQDFGYYTTLCEDSLRFNLGFNVRYGMSPVGPVAGTPIARSMKTGYPTQLQLWDRYAVLRSGSSATDTGVVSFRNQLTVQYNQGAPAAVFTNGLTPSVAYPHTHGIKVLNTFSGDDTSCVLLDARQGAGDVNRFRVTGDGMSWQRGATVGSWTGSHNGHVTIDSIGKVAIVASDSSMGTLQVDASGTLHNNTNVNWNNTRRKAGTAFKFESYRDGILGVRMYHYGTGAAGSTLAVTPHGYTIIDTTGKWGFSTTGYPDSMVTVGKGVHIQGGLKVDTVFTLTNGVWKDVVADASRLKTKGVGGIVYDDSSATIRILGTVDSTAEYISASYQFNHDRILTSEVHPHVHIWQTSSSRPYLKLWYRWQQNGHSKTQAWTAVPCTTRVHTYVSGTLNQILEYESIAAPDSSALSDILQIKLTRNPGGPGDPGAGTEYNILGMDVHYKADALGSRLEYTK